MSCVCAGCWDHEQQRANQLAWSAVSGWRLGDVCLGVSTTSGAQIGHSGVYVDACYCLHLLGSSLLIILVSVFMWFVLCSISATLKKRLQASRMNDTWTRKTGQNFTFPKLIAQHAPSNVSTFSNLTGPLCTTFQRCWKVVFHFCSTPAPQIVMCRSVATTSQRKSRRKEGK